MPVFRNRQRPDKQMVQQRKIKQNRSPFESVAAYSLVTEQHTRTVIGMCGRKLNAYGQANLPEGNGDTQKGRDSREATHGETKKNETIVNKCVQIIPIE